jgi:hypothetical protein
MTHITQMTLTEKDREALLRIGRKRYPNLKRVATQVVRELIWEEIARMEKEQENTDVEHTTD